MRVMEMPYEQQRMPSAIKNAVNLMLTSYKTGLQSEVYKKVFYLKISTP